MTKTNLQIHLKALFLLSGTLLFSTALNGAWTLITDFSEFTPGNQIVEAEPAEGGNYVLIGYPEISRNMPAFADVLSEADFGLINTETPDNIVFNFWGDNVGGSNNRGLWAYFPLPQDVPNGDVVTLYWRQYNLGPRLSMNVGLSDRRIQTADPERPFAVTYPGEEWGAFEAQHNMTDTTIRMRDPILGPWYDSGVPFPIGEWVEIFMVIDNGNFRSQLYYKTAADSEPQLIPFVRGEAENTAGRPDNYAYFRNFAPGLTAEQFVGERSNPEDPESPLDGTLKAVMMGIGSFELFDLTHFDDIHIDYTGMNLTSPGETASTYAGYPIQMVDEKSWIQSEEFGWLYIGSAPWLWSTSLQNYVWGPEASFGVAGGWFYIAK